MKQAEASSAASTRRRPAARSASWRSCCLAATASPALLKAAFLSRSAAEKPLSFSSCASLETTSARKDNLAASPAHPAAFSSAGSSLGVHTGIPMQHLEGSRWKTCHACKDPSTLQNDHAKERFCVKWAGYHGMQATSSWHLRRLQRSCARAGWRCVRGLSQWRG